jgi:hypothetical protein
MPRIVGAHNVPALPQLPISLIWTAKVPSEGFEMPAIVSTATMSRPLLLVALLVGLMLAATLMLWGYYGTAVFFEMVRAGWIACF